MIFRTDGDHVTVCDTDEDGYAAYLERQDTGPLKWCATREWQNVN